MESVIHNKNIIRISEYEKLYYDNAKPFKQKHWEMLCCYQQKQKAGPDFFKIINKGIQATSYVGVLQAGNLTIEILPKTDSHAATAINENIAIHTTPARQYWRNALLRMLKECRLLPFHQAGSAYLNLDSNSILDIYLNLFLAEAAQLLHEGLAKSYVVQAANKPVLKGQLIFSRQIQNNIHQERFFTRSSVYENDTILNRTLQQTLQLIKETGTKESVEKAAQLLSLFPKISNQPVVVEELEQLSFDRKTERYRKAVTIAKMLLQHYQPGIAGGNEKAIAIMFDMNALWEEWVYRRLKKEEARFGIQVLRQQSTPFWEAPQLVKVKSIRPDIVVQQGNRTIVIDTKWKLTKNHTPSDNDLKQMFVYNLYWQCNEGILLYPANEATIAVSGNYKPFTSLANHTCKCVVMTASIFDENNKPDTQFASKLLAKILGTK